MVGLGAPRYRAQMYKRTPEARKRTPPMMKGGIVCIAYRIARYVDPQTR
jgi:hypothetical protein